MGLSEDEFYSMTPRTFLNALEGWQAIYRTDMEIRRIQTLYQVNMMAKKPIHNPKRLWKYSWEEQEGLSEEKAEEVRKKGIELAKKLKL